MRIAVLHPGPIPYVHGGAERGAAGRVQAINEYTPHSAELVQIPVREDTTADLVAGYRTFTELDLTPYDVVISTKYPTWIASHPYHVLHMNHPLRGVYDTYHLFGLPTEPDLRDPALVALHEVVRDPASGRATLDEFFERFDRAVAKVGADHPALALPGPLCRRIVHWLDRQALAPPAMRRYRAISWRVTHRPGYFPCGVRARGLHHPSDLPGLHPGEARHLFTASRLDGPKRVELLIAAMAYVPFDIPFYIAGNGPERERLEALAAGDPRIHFLGFVADDALADWYADALAVPFVPLDEDLGLITFEALGCATPVVTCHDSGGTTEFVTDSVTGLIADPTPASIGMALARLVADPDWARRLGETGRQRVSRVTWKRVVEGLLGPDAYRATAATPAAARPADDAPTTAGGNAAHGSAGADAAAAVTSDGGQRAGRAVTASHRPKVVVVSTYAVHPPRHGGQLRCAHLYDPLAAVADVDIVSLVAEEHPESQREIGPGIFERIVPMGASHLQLGHRLAAQVGMPVTDIIAGTRATSSPRYLSVLDEATADAAVVLLAHPYLLPAVELIGREAPLIYDAHNVELDLKAAALPDTPPARELLAVVREVEGRATAASAAVVACSPADAATLEGHYGRPIENIDVIPNGTNIDVPFPTTFERVRSRDRWLTRFASRHGGPTFEHLALFLASWHPPNIDAAELVLEMAPRLPGVLFLMAGAHGLAFRTRRTPPNVVFAGMISEHAKAALLSCADVALNPMRHGSGTNLKLIEYFARGAPVVSTAFGVRGLDVDHRYCLVAEPDGLTAAVAEAVNNPVAAHQRAELARAFVAENYAWPTLAQRLRAIVFDVIGNRRAMAAVRSNRTA